MVTTPTPPPTTASPRSESRDSVCGYWVVIKFSPPAGRRADRCDQHSDQHQGALELREQRLRRRNISRGNTVSSAGQGQRRFGYAGVCAQPVLTLRRGGAESANRLAETRSTPGGCHRNVPGAVFGHMSRLNRVKGLSCTNFSRAERHTLTIRPSRIQASALPSDKGKPAMARRLPSSKSCRFSRFVSRLAPRICTFRICLTLAAARFVHENRFFLRACTGRSVE